MSAAADNHGSGPEEGPGEVNPSFDMKSGFGFARAQRVEQQLPRVVVGQPDTSCRRWRLAAPEHPALPLARQRPLTAARTADVDGDVLPRFGGHVAKRVRQSAHGDIDHGAEIAWIRKRLGADRHPDLLLVVPQFRELTTDVEP